MTQTAYFLAVACFCLPVTFAYSTDHDGSIEDPPPEGPPIVFPIEVLGPNNTVESVTIDLPEGASATSLWLRIHGLTFEGKASVRINGGTWVTLTDSNVVYPRLEAAYWGMGGPLSTLRMSVPTTNWTLVDGGNQLEFRFNDLDRFTIGYRVLGLRFLAGTNELAPANPFVWDDPELWTGPSSNPSDIAFGKLAWYKQPIQERGTNLVARCTDCHAHDGRDLKYFNYSDRAIIARSVFHSIPPATATNIASYIRSLPIPYEENGRPWNPPYQPGPGLDSKPVRSWAAGAGLEWVLDDDLETLNYLFPEGINASAVGGFTNTLSAREIPLALQFPDWNHWLPRIHPLDAYYTYYRTNRYHTMYAELISGLATRPGLAGAVFVDSKKTVWDSYSRTGGIVRPPTSDPGYSLWIDRMVGISHWRVVKTWEMMNERNLQEYGTPLYGAHSANRRWFHGEVFNLGPHKLQTPRNDAWFAESMQWYQLQLVLNDGNRRNGTSVPVDWGYLHALNVSSWENPTTDFVTYGIMILNVIKGTEGSWNDLPLTHAHGWGPFRGEIWRTAPLISAPKYERIPLATRRAVAEALVEPWLSLAESYTREEYDLAKKLLDSTELRGRVYNMCVKFKGWGVNPELVHRLATWGQYIWPNHNWAPAFP